MVKANIDRVTMTGPDDSIRPRDLIALTERYPFVEWGILISKSQEGSPRFPSQAWIKELQSLKSSLPNLSLHNCGRWVRQLLIGENELPSHLLDGFNRIQLNFHAENTTCNGEAFHRVLRTLGDREFIFQIDGAGGNRHMETLWDASDKTGEPVRSVALFDVSGGAGVVPREWPKPIWMLDDEWHDYHGYAGGLGPQNLEQQIPRILEAAGDRCTRIWIDMETHIRSEDDRQFDLAKVEKCLELSKPFVS